MRRHGFERACSKSSLKGRETNFLENKLATGTVPPSALGGRRARVEVEVVDEPPHDDALHRVLLSKVDGGGLDDVEELGHDGGDAAEVVRTRARLGEGVDAVKVDVRRERGGGARRGARVHLAC
eukprot:6200564-Pleurochrysis_carterae.AAC.3